MKFNKLALAAAIAAAPATGLAMEPMNDADMSGVTGQDGISIDLSTQLTTDLYVHDTDGIAAKTSQSGTAYTYADSGAIVIQGFGLSDGAAGDALIAIDIDAGTDAGTAGTETLNIDVTLGDGTTDTVVDLGTLAVADSNRTAASADDANWGVDTVNQVNIMDMGSLTIGGGTSIGIQLGSEPQDHMIWLDTTIAGGISLANFSVTDAGGAVTGGSIGASNLAIVDTGGTGAADLTLDVGIDANASGLVVTLNQLGTSAGGADIRIVDQYLGTNATANVIGDVEVVGLNLNGTTLTITGK